MYQFIKITEDYNSKKVSFYYLPKGALTVRGLSVSRGLLLPEMFSEETRKK